MRTVLAAVLALLAPPACSPTCDPPRHMVSYQALDGFPNFKCVAGPVPATNAPRRP